MERIMERTLWNDSKFREVNIILPLEFMDVITGELSQESASALFDSDMKDAITLTNKSRVKAFLKPYLSLEMLKVLRINEIESHVNAIQDEAVRDEMLDVVVAKYNHLNTTLKKRYASSDSMMKALYEAVKAGDVEAFNKYEIQTGMKVKDIETLQRYLVNASRRVVERNKKKEATTIKKAVDWNSLAAFKRIILNAVMAHIRFTSPRIAKHVVHIAKNDMDVMTKVHWNEIKDNKVVMTQYSVKYGLPVDKKTVGEMASRLEKSKHIVFASQAVVDMYNSTYCLNYMTREDYQKNMIMKRKEG